MSCASNSLIGEFLVDIFCYNGYNYQRDNGKI
uniref:Uncharacterized protein n=1 Tax=Lepeophtheirus salmonis TaxID=72036 RepID=A0A0K2TLR3_LEPSM